MQPDAFGASPPTPAPNVPPYVPPAANVDPPPVPVPVRPNPSTRRGPRIRILLALLLTISLVALGGVAGAARFDDAPVYPRRWDPRVADIARFVEQHRGLDFRHPVQIYFLAPARYREIAGGGPTQSAPTAGERRQADQSVAEYRALGLMDGAPDLLSASETLQDSGTLAFYSPEDDVVNVRGTKMTPGLRVTLAHELTHALQDQHFDLSPIGDAASADESGAARAVVEGDAVAVEHAYIETLSAADRASYEAESRSGGDEADADLADVPTVLQVLFGSYYAVGNAFVDFVQADAGGASRPGNVDAVLRRLPRGSSQLFEPAIPPARRDPVTVTPPDPAGGATVLEQSTHGVDLLFLMLAERIDPLQALAATDGWRGDAYTASTSPDGRTCVASRIEFASPADTEEFQNALVAWAATMPADSGRSVVPADDQRSIRFTTCDPGPDAKMRLTGNAGTALGYPVTRLRAAASAIRSGRSRADALCYGNAVIRRLTLDDLRATERTPAIEAALSAAAADCP